MKRLTHITLLFLFLLVSPLCRADRETVSHVFHTMDKKTDLIFSNDNKTATTALLTYTCATGSEFARDHVYDTYISAVLVASTGTVTTTQVKELTGFHIVHFPLAACTNVKVYVSKTGVFDGVLPLSGDNITYNSTGTIDVTIPRGNYYIKIVNTDGSNKFSIRSMYYYLDHCNCFEYVPE